MARPYDTTGKDLIEQDPVAWLQFTGLPANAPVRVIDADLATVAAAADKLIRVDADDPWIAHLELVSWAPPDFGVRMGRYNLMIDVRHRVPVRTVAILLRPQADGPHTNGLVQRQLPGEKDSYLHFRCNVVRVWQVLVAAVLAGGLGTLPLAPISDVDQKELPSVIQRMDARLRKEVTPARAGELWMSTAMLMGLRYPDEVIQMLLSSEIMKDSVVYQRILREGREEGRAEGRAAEARAILLRLGRKQLGEPTAAVTEALEQIADVERLEQLSERLLDVHTWDDLLAGA